LSSRRGGRLPVVLFSHGAHDHRADHTVVVQELASHGYVVVTVDHTYDAFSQFPDGRVIVPLRDHPLGPADFAEDVRFVLDQIEEIDAGRNPDAGHRPLPAGLCGALDRRRIGMFGWSKGATATARVMYADRRVRAGLSLDGPMEPVMTAPLDRPFMLMTAEFTRAAEPSVAEFWSHLLVSETPGSVPVLARYDGQRPLAPWLIRVFQNWHVSQIRSHPGSQTLPEDDIALPLPVRQEDRWHDLFCSAARDWLTTLSEQEVLLLGLRWRYRLSQRDISHLFGVHEGTISRQTDKLRDRCLERIGKKLTAEGWTGDDLEGFILTELGSLLVDDPHHGPTQPATRESRRS